MKNDTGTPLKNLWRRFHSPKAAASQEMLPPETPPENAEAAEPSVIDWKQAKALKGRVVVPEGMTEIRDRLFMGNKEITSVVIPGTVKHIGELAFNNCENLEEVVLNEGVERIDSCAFRGTKLRGLTYPDSVRVTDGRAFCRVKLEAPVMNASRTRLVCATENLTGEAYAVPEGTEVIGPRAFDGHKGLKALRLPDSLRQIEDWAFYGCGMTELTIPTSVQSVGTCAFMNCGALKRVRILNPRAIIRSGAFSDCRALERIEWAGNRTTIDYCHLLGIPFMAAGGRLPEANLPHIGEARFKRLTELCAEGRADPMEALAEWFEAWSRKPGASDFYRRAANFWHFRAYARRQPQAVEWMEAWLTGHPNEHLPSLLYEDIELRRGLNAGSASGRMLNDLGFAFFDPERSYHLRTIAGTGVVEASAYESEDGPDEDGFGREDYYDWWYLDDNLQPIPGVRMMHSYSNHDKRNAAKEFDALIAEASRVVHARRQYSAELDVEEDGGFFDIPGFEYRRAVWDGWETERPFPEDILRLDPHGDFFEFYGQYDGGTCELNGKRRMEVFPLKALRAESLALEKPLVKLSVEWETWIPEEDLHRLLSEKLLILGKITPAPAYFHDDYLGYVKGRFFCAPYTSLLTALLHVSHFMDDDDDDDEFVLGGKDLVEDATLRGLMRKLISR